MDLILWRHAEAVDADDPQEDAMRPLTAKGERQAKRMAKWLDQHLPDRARVLASPTQRTRQTAHALDRKHKCHPALQPGETAEALLEAAGWPDARDPVLVIGHQPTLGLVATRLLNGECTEGLPPLAIRKGAVWWFRRRERDDGTIETVLQTVLSPDRI